MVQYLRNHQRKKCEKKYLTEDEEYCDTFLIFCVCKRKRPRLLSFFFLSLLSCSFIFLSPHLFYSNTGLSLLLATGFVASTKLSSSISKDSRELYSSISKGIIICDRSSFRSDICIMKGDVRTHSASSSIFVYKSTHRTSFINYVASILKEKEEEETVEELQHEKIKPYTRKWEKSTMDTITELNLIAKKHSLMSMQHECDVQHEVPAVFFSTSGYTGNFYHEFNDGILPLYITSQHLRSKVVFVILDFHDWWLTKYGNILSQLSDYAVIDFDEDTRTHCFPEAIVGLRIHHELSINSSLMEGNKSIVDFRNLLDQAYLPRIHSLIREKEERKAQEKFFESMYHTWKIPFKVGMEVHKTVHQLKRPTLAIMSRNGSRSIMNENFLVKMAVKIGFQVEVLRPKRTTELAKIYWVLNSSDVMIGVHGAAMTHFLFMRPGSVFIQIIPIGTAWAAEEYYGAPAKKLGLKYIGYEILTTESSLYDKYELDDPVLADPTRVTEQGWQITKKIYLQGQTVRLDLIRFRKQLVEAYDYIIDRI